MDVPIEKYRNDECCKKRFKKKIEKEERERFLVGIVPFKDNKGIVKTIGHFNCFLSQSFYEDIRQSSLKLSSNNEGLYLTGWVQIQ
jgi:hypothetical protein